MTLDGDRSQDELVLELLRAVSQQRWQERYRALERSIELPANRRREIAQHFVGDSNAFVSSLAQRLSDSEGRPTIRSRRGIVQAFDQLLHGARLSVGQRSDLIRLFEDAQEAGSIGYLALSADRAARLVTAALSAPADSRETYLQQLDRFLRHIAAYASPIQPGSERIPIATAIADAKTRTNIPIFLDRSVETEVNEVAFTSALEELVANAVDAGASEVRVSVLPTNGHVRAVISNDGKPIDSSVSNHLFEPWYTTRAGRAGLGLYLARAIAREAGGDITVRQGDSSIFQVELPASPE
jgi:signal transduction histidine kinase